MFLARKEITRLQQCGGSMGLGIFVVLMQSCVIVVAGRKKRAKFSSPRDFPVCCLCSLRLSLLCAFFPFSIPLFSSLLYSLRCSPSYSFNLLFSSLLLLKRSPCPVIRVACACTFVKSKNVPSFSNCTSCRIDSKCQVAQSARQQDESVFVNGNKGKERAPVQP